MSTITTTTAAQQAGVTVATIRTWCRRGVVVAVKATGRWAIQPASLARRIQIGQERTRVQPTFTLTSKTRRVRGHIGVVGDAAALKAAFKSGAQITLSGKFAGERVYLGHSRQTYGDYGITMETIGLDRELPDGRAVYLLDFDRLDDAPRLSAYIDEVEAQTYQAAAEAEARAAREDDDYLNPRYL